MARRGRRTALVVCCWLVWLAQTVGGADWPQFRGPYRDAISRETGLLRAWPESGPRVLWTVAVCVGFSGAAIHDERVYFNDYDRESSEWLVRCVRLADGRELWRFREKRRIRPNHGITRTVPAVDGRYVFSLDPKAVLHCLDADSGREIWRKNLVREYQTRIPPWYVGQCPLIEPERVIVAPAGNALLVAFDKATGNEIWRTPNPAKWPMSHSSVMPAELCGVKQYLYCTLKGPLGVSAETGKLLWHFRWKFNVAVAPSPLAVDGARVFMTAGYDAGSLMIRIKRNGQEFSAEHVFDLPTEVWNSEVQTPILLDGHLFAVGKKKRGLFTCLDLAGRQVWTSAGRAAFGLGSYLAADGMFFVLEGKTGMLRLIEADPGGYKELAAAQLLRGPDAWAPMALSDGKLVLRDMSRMICVEVSTAADPRPSPATRPAARER